MGDIDRDKSLQELEQCDWGEPTFDSHVVTTCHDLRRKPLIKFTIEDLRLMISQEMGLAFLMPLAIEGLEAEPLSAGDLYHGDLLAAVLRTNDAFWVSHPDYSQRIRQVINQLRDSFDSLAEMDRQTAGELLEGIPTSLTQ